MASKNEPPASSTILRLTAVVVIVGWLAALVVPSSYKGLLLTFAWLDVAVVTILCGLPIAWLAVTTMTRHFMGQRDTSVPVLVVGIALLVIFRVVLWEVANRDAAVDVIVSGSAVTRILSALLASFGIVGTLSVFAARPLHSDKLEAPGSTPTHWLFAILLLVLVPATYAHAKGEANAKTALDYLAQSRFVEASDLLNRCMVLDSTSSSRGKLLHPLVIQLNAKIPSIQQQVEQPLSPVASTKDRIERAIQLAILNRREESLLLLLPLAQSSEFAASGGHELLGTIYQDRRDWEESLFHFRLASEFWQAESSSPVLKRGLIQSIQGQAYAHRKLGRIAQAEAMYAQLIELSPTAEHHFLLAQFYEDIQDTPQAALHARRAMEISPEHYKASAGALITKMKTNHFGCFQLYAD